MAAPDAQPKVQEALSVVSRCRTPDGFRASGHLYPELWVRDLVYSEDVLLRLGHAQTVRRHFESFLRLQRPNGQLPTAVTTGLRRVMNQRFHFWTSDGEILFLIGTAKYIAFTDDIEFQKAHAPELEACLSFVEARRNRLGFVPGGDWRDAVPDFRRRCLLSNQAQLVEMYASLGVTEKAEGLKEAIREHFIPPDGHGLANGVSGDDEARRDGIVDSLGTSLSVLNGTVRGESASAAMAALTASKTAHGYRNMYPPIRVRRLDAFKSFSGANAFVRNGAFLRNGDSQYQNSTIWPFVESRVLAALRTVGLDDEARRLSLQMMEREGLHEWYSPVTGRGMGSRDQLWTAAAILASAGL